MYGLYQIVYFTTIDIINTLKSPFFIFFLLIIYLQYIRVGKMEKENLGYKKSAIKKLMTSTIFGLYGGILTTILFLYLGVVIEPKDYIYILITSTILSFFNPRYMCFSYGSSLVSMVSLIFGFPKINTYQVMNVVAILHMVESILILIDGGSNRLPIFLEKKYEIVGGFTMNRFWLVPFVVFIGDGLIRPITLMAILSYEDYSIVSCSIKKIIKTSLLLFLYSIMLLLISRSIINPFIAPLFALMGHEMLIVYNNLKEKKDLPIYTSFHKGVRVLEVVPDTVGHKLRIKTGDIILGINGAEVNNSKDLEDISNIKFTNVKIKLFNMRSGLVVKRYYGKEKPLGLIIVPRDF